MKKKPGIAGIIIGLAIVVVGVVAGVITIVATAVNSTAGLSQAQTFASDDAPVEVTLNAGDPMGIWVTRETAGNCQVSDPSLSDVPLTTSGFASETVNDFDLAATFTPPVDGVYTVMCQSTSFSFSYKVAPVIEVAGLAVGIVVGVLLIVFGFIIGAAVSIVTIVRRSSWNSKNAAKMVQPAQMSQPMQADQPVQPAQQYPPSQPLPTS